MSVYRTLPLGVDLGASRVRIALAEAASPDDVRLKAVSARDITDDVRDDRGLIGALIEEIIAELGVRTRNCVAALGAPDAVLRVIHFPKMSWQERLRAARYEAQRFAPPDADGMSLVRVHRSGDRENTFAIGVTRQSKIGDRVALLKQARLRVIAIDHDALALRRAIPFADAILDIGSVRSTLHQYTAAAPFSHAISIGGADVTKGIARELSIDWASAERRKRILGSAGAGVSVRAALTSEFATVIERARARAPITRIVLVGNGARLPSLVADIEQATGATTELLIPPLLQTDAYPEDVIRSAAPDWMLCAALTTWGLAA
ncbi:MAG: pilus assembly protein PilM [Candidatus Eremiobacteraeota bacterium]|nr:pilus assembly protein PilM [Candidatus Eremiobacteraeota bacterium]